MALVSTIKQNEKALSYPRQAELPWAASLLWFLGLSFLIGAVTLWVLTHQYLSDYATTHWAKVLGVLDSSAGRLEYLGLVYPHLPFYLLFPFHYIPTLDSGAAPYLVSTLAAAGVLTYWNAQMARVGYALGTRVLLMALMIAHPYFLWPATTGSQTMLSIAGYYALATTILRMVAVQDTRAFMMLGLVVTGYFFVDERVMYLMIAMLPMMPLMMPQILLQEAAFSAYLVAFTPWMLAFFAWAYINWLYLHDPWAFLTSPDSAFRHAWTSAMSIPYLVDFGGRLFAGFVQALLYAIVSFPIIALLMGRASRVSYLFNACIVIFGLPLVATGIATADWYLPHPISMLFLLAPATMVAVILAAQAHVRAPMLLVIMMGVSTLTGWWTFMWAPSPDMRDWVAALRGQQIEEKYQAERDLGVWLDKNRRQTLMDDHMAYPALVARGDAKGIILPFSREFKMHMLRRTVTADQVVVPDPKHKAAHDIINQNYPRLYERGQSGYQLVYDRNYWRVYRRMY